MSTSSSSSNSPSSCKELAADFSFQNSTEDALAYDHQHIWHPYSSMKESSMKESSIPKEQTVWPVASAKGVYLTLADGTELIDGMSSWWSTIHGYSHQG